MRDFKENNIKKNYSLNMSKVLKNPRNKLMEWQPIETAPKDGSLIIVCGGNPIVKRNSDIENQPYIARWISLSTERKGAWVTSRQIESVLSCYLDPTHWMPLPEPPE